MKKKLIALGLAASMVATLAACGSSNNTTTTTAATTTAAATTTGAETTTAKEVEKGTVKIVHLLDITGTEAVTGAQAQAAFNYAVLAMQEDSGWTFEVTEGDCQSDSSKAATVAAQMVEDGVIAIFGPTQIGHKAAVAGALEDKGVPLVFYNGTPIGMTKSSPWVIALGGGTAAFPTVMADYAYNELGLKTVWTIRQGTTGGDNYVLPFETCFKAMGGTVAGSDYVQMGTTDWSSYLTNIINSGAEAIVGWTSSSDAIAFYKSWYDTGAYQKLPVVGTMHGGFTDYYIMMALKNGGYEAAVDALMEKGLYAPINWCYSIDTTTNEKFVEGWVSFTGGTLASGQEVASHEGKLPGGNNLPGSCYQALLLLTTALDEVGADADPADLRDAMLASTIDGPEGETSFADGSCVAVKDVYVVRDVKLDDGTYNYEVVKTYKAVPATGYNYDGENYTGK